MKRPTQILHMDGDAFFVGVEVAKDQKLRGLPVVTGEERGIVSALSYEAKALGIKRGMPIFKLKRDFPQIIILPGDYRSYAKYSSWMFDIVRRYADEVEEYSIDECFADLTGLDKPLYMTYREIVERIKKEITKELDLSVSIGLAPTKCLAKLASKWHKPNGLTIIEAGSEKNFLQETPIEKIWGIGRQTGEFLKRRKIMTALDFVQKDISWIKENMSEPFQVIWHELRGTKVMKVDPEPKTEYSSMQRTRTFYPSTNDKVFLLSQLSKNIEEVCKKARHHKLVPKSISFFLKSKDFRYYGFGLDLDAPTNAPEILVSLVKKFFSKMHKEGIIYRTTGVTLSGLVPQGASQMDLFGGTEISSKFEKIHDQIDSLEEKFGKKVVYLGSTAEALKHNVKGTDADDPSRDLVFL